MFILNSSIRKDNIICNADQYKWGTSGVYTNMVFLQIEKSFEHALHVQ